MHSGAHARTDRVGAFELFAYALPSSGIGTLLFLNSMLLLQYATEVLFVAPAFVGAVLFSARVWDAITDPLVGNLSDRTRSRLGRRRPWMLASILPIFAMVVMLWSPPESLSDRALEVWLAVAVIGFYTATTIFYVPYQSLGAELSKDYHERTRIFGAQQAVQIAGTLVAALFYTWVMYWAEDPRAAARGMAVALGSFMAISVVLAVRNVQERAEHQGRGGRYVVPGLMFVPVTVRLSRSFGKLRTVRAGLCCQALGFVLLATLGPGDFWLACAFVSVMSIGSVAGAVIAPSLQSDVIDWDDLQSGERKEGAYFAVRSFVTKIGFGTGPLVVGLLLQWTGFDPGGGLDDRAVFGMRMLIGPIPAATALIGAVVIGFMRLDEAEHAKVRAALDARDATAAASGA